MAVLWAQIMLEFDKKKQLEVKIDLRDPVHFIAFGFGSGLSPIAPGTAGTFAAIPLYLLLSVLPTTEYLLLIFISFAFGIWVCSASAQKIGVHDYSGIVWDEIVGYLIVMAPYKATLFSVIAGFVTFRFFDIFKPWPIRWIDRYIHGGLGIMLDDVLAAFFASGLMFSTLMLCPDFISPYMQLRFL